MPKDVRAYPEVSASSVTTSALKVPNGVILMNSGQDSLTYTQTTYNLTTSSIADLNARSFTLTTLSVTVVQIGKEVRIRLYLNATGTAGAVNKYEITLPTLPATIPTLVRGVGTVYDTNNTNSIDIINLFIYGGNKVRFLAGNTNNVVTTNSTSDYSFSTNRNCFANCSFWYLTS